MGNAVTLLLIGHKMGYPLNGVIQCILQWACKPSLIGWMSSHWLYTQCNYPFFIYTEYVGRDDVNG